MISFLLLLSSKAPYGPTTDLATPCRNSLMSNRHEHARPLQRQVPTIQDIQKTVRFKFIDKVTVVVHVVLQRKGRVIRT